MHRPEPYIAGVAIKTPSGTVHSLPRPNRHHDVIFSLRDEITSGGLNIARCTQGFVLSNGDFVDRKEALKYHHGKHLIEDELYSEDCW